MIKTILKTSLYSFIISLSFNCYSQNFEWVQQYQNIDTPNFPIASGNMIASGDVDGDGDLDVIIAVNNEVDSLSTRLFLNDGNGNFTYKTEIGNVSLEGGFLEFFDIDKDNDLDLFYSGDTYYGTNKTLFYRNDGEGNFSNENLGIENIEYGSISFTDIDHDDDYDFFISGVNENYDRISVLYTNQNNSIFIPNYNFKGLAQGDVSFIDLNKNGSPDIISTGNDNDHVNQTYIYFNDGSGNFSISPQNLSSLIPSSSSLAFGDIDNDNDIDLMLNGWDSSNPNNPYIGKTLINDGTGYFQVEENNIKSQSGYFDHQLIDIDNDNDLDLIVSADSSVMYINDGSGHFVLDSFQNFNGLSYKTFATGDFNNDSKNDIIFTGNSTHIFFNTENSLLKKREPMFSPVINSCSVTGDIDNDGDLDIIISGKESNNTTSTKVYTNDGNGHFDLSPNRLPGFEYGRLELLHIDSDSTLDLVLHGNKFCYIYTNDGNGNFIFKSDMHLQSGSSIGSGDIDNDGDIDLILTTRIYINDGNGNYSWENSITGNTELYLIDIDGDNDLDIATLSDNNINIYLNDGNGKYSKSTNHNLTGYGSMEIAFADIDDDDDLDVFISGQIEYFGVYQNRIFVNNGHGQFSLKGQLKNGLHSFYTTANGVAKFQDIDNDGDEDLVITGRNRFPQNQFFIFINDGLGNFERKTHQISGTHSGSLDLNDFNGDGFTDLVLTGTDPHSAPYASLFKYTPVECNVEPTTDTIFTCDYHRWLNDIIYRENNFTDSIILKNNNGCDSVVKLHLTIYPVRFYDTLEIIEGETFYWDETRSYNKSGIYNNWFQQLKSKTTNCDSTTYLNLKVKSLSPPYSVLKKDTITLCENLPYSLFYDSIFKDDHTPTIDLAYNVSSLNNKTLQMSQYIHFRPWINTLSPEDYDEIAITATDLGGASFTEKIYLKIIPNADTLISDTINLGESAFFHEVEYFQETIIDTTFSSIHGCDSLVKYRLYFRPEILQEIDTIKIDVDSSINLSMFEYFNSLSTNEVLNFNFEANNTQIKIKNTITSSYKVAYNISPNNFVGETKIKVTARTSQGIENQFSFILITTNDDSGTISSLEPNLTSTQNNIYVYPNPSSGDFTIMSDEIIKNVKVFSINGHLVKESTGKNQNLKNLPKGFYILEIQTFDNTETIKIYMK